MVVRCEGQFVYLDFLITNIEGCIESISAANGEGASISGLSECIRM